MPVRQAFSSPGGKSHLAPKISALIPKHRTYVEPFAGGAAVFFHKEPSLREVLNDKDSEIAFAYRFIKNMTDEQYKRLRQFDWHRKESIFNRLKRSKPKSSVDRFHRFYYLLLASFAHGRESFSSGGEGRKINISKLIKCKQRLKGVTILSMDGVAVISKYNSQGTFFYVDPPFPERSFAGRGAMGFDENSLAKLVKRLQTIRGKFILSLGTEHEKLLPKRWHTKRVGVKRKIVDPRTGKPIPRGFEILAANFKI